MSEHSTWSATEVLEDDDLRPDLTTDPPAPEPVVLPSLGEVLDSLTGFDEVAIEGIFKSHLESLSGIRLFRAGAFTLLRRQKTPDAEAFRTVMAMPSREIQAMFRTDKADEPTDDEDGDDDEGKA